VEDEVRALFLAHEHLARSVRPAELASAARAHQRHQQRTRRLTALVALGVAATVGAVLATSWSGDQTPAPQPAARVVPRDLPADLRERALHVLDRYEAAAGDSSNQALSVAGPLLTQVGDWEPTFEDGKRALLSRQIDPAEPLSTVRPPDGDVTWPEGKSLDVPLLSAAEAVARAGRDRVPCSTCTPLTVTGARLTTTTLETGLGSATVPAWELSLKGTRVRLSYVAVDPASLIDLTPLEQPDNDHFVIDVRQVEVAKDGRTVEVTFWGGRPGCVGGYHASAVESRTAVVTVVVSEPLPNPDTASMAGCGLAMAYESTATVTLARPLGDRTLLDPVSGRPVQRLPTRG
jgi:hypothetical protein